MEKKARVKRLKHQDDVKRSWAATYLLEESFLEKEEALDEEKPEEPAPQLNQPASNPQ